MPASAVTGEPDRPTIDLLGDRTICHSIGRSASPGGADGAVPARDVTGQLQSVDHVAYCLPWRRAESAAHAYEKVFDLRRLDADSFDEVGYRATGMRSIVLRSAAGFTVVLTEPVVPGSTGQTQRFVDAHAGPGVQHAALAYRDLVTAVKCLRDAGVDFLPIPALYYDQARQQLGDVPVPWSELQRLHILADADDRGVLFQLFTRPITDRGTFFFELIQRAGATGSGANNVRALFAAVEGTASGLSHPAVTPEEA